MTSTAGHGVYRGGNAEGAGLGNRFAQEVNQRVKWILVFLMPAEVSSSFILPLLTNVMRSGPAPLKTLEPQPALFETHPTLLADHQMVEHLNVQKSAGLDDPPGHGDILR